MPLEFDQEEAKAILRGLEIALRSAKNLNKPEHRPKLSDKSKSIIRNDIMVWTYLINKLTEYLKDA